MLPDFPAIRQAFERRMLRSFEAHRAAATHVFSEMPKIRLHEGHRFVIVLEDGTEREIEMKEIRVEASISDAEYQELTPAELGRRVEEAATEMARKQLDIAYKELDRAVKSVGNVVDARGSRLGPEHVFKSLEIVLIDFDSAGRPKLPTVIIHPDVFERYKQVLETIESTPALSRRMAEIIAAKKEEWRGREGNRKLVG